VLDMTGHTWVKFINSTAALVLAIGLSALLVPPLGIIGAALAALGSLGGVNVLRLVQVKLLVGVLPYNAAFLKPIAAALLGGGAAYAVSRPLVGLGPFPGAVVGIAVLAAVYVATLLLLGIDEDDRVVLSRVRDRLLRRRRRRTDATPSATAPLGTDPDDIATPLPAIASAPWNARDHSSAG
jgi:O-antigen/teichoic acid export membrane protein